MCWDPCEQLAVICNTALTVALLVPRVLHYSASLYFRVLVPMEYKIRLINYMYYDRFFDENHWEMHAVHAQPWLLSIML